MKPGNRLPLFVAIAIVFAVLAATFLMRGGREPANVELDAAPVAREVQTPLARGPAATRPAPVQPHNAAVDSAVLGHVEERNRKREEQRARTAALKEQSARRFASEQVDPAWAPAKVTELDGIAADPVTRRVYVSDRSNERIQVFDENGTILDALWDLGGKNHPMITSMREHKGYLYIGGILNNRVGRYRIPNADPNWTGIGSYWGAKA